MLIQFFILRSWVGSRRAQFVSIAEVPGVEITHSTKKMRGSLRLFLLQCKTLLALLLVIVSIPVLLNWVWEKYGPMMMKKKKKEQWRKKLLPDYYFSRAIKWKPSFLGFVCCVTKLWFFTSWTHWRLLYYHSKLLMKQRWKLSPYNPLQAAG